MKTWNTDFGQAPRPDTKFLVKLEDGDVTTAYFYWYVEGDGEGFTKIQMWALQDSVRDCPLDDIDPSLKGLSWMLMP